jgi:hypothetical protein
MVVRYRWTPLVLTIAGVPLVLLASVAVVHPGGGPAADLFLVGAVAACVAFWAGFRWPRVLIDAHGVDVTNWRVRITHAAHADHLRFGRKVNAEGGQQVWLEWAGGRVSIPAPDAPLLASGAAAPAGDLTLDRDHSARLRAQPNHPATSMITSTVPERLNTDTAPRLLPPVPTLTVTALGMVSPGVQLRSEAVG